MLDLAFIRSNPDAVKEAARLKNNNIETLQVILTAGACVIFAQ